MPVDNIDARFARYARDAVLADIDAELDLIADDANSLDPAERRREQARLADEILAAERIEECLATACESAGISVERRPDASPLAILGVDIASEEIENAA
jgi:hypothetical protein